ncbi:MAG TPA: acyltransferase [Reyranella sp.]|jgi:peptidoglycan/LPS O-acetylase OafA/YrhL
MRFSEDLPHARHSQGLDVLRAICALAVFFFHCGLANFGWLGVQVFFVISGFLITRSLESRQEGTASQRMLAFYGRRARRILPPVYLSLLLLAPFAFLLQRELVTGWLAAVTFTYNFYNLTASFLNTPFLSHLWSLAVEEQFYLVFPLLMVLARRRATPVLLLLCLAMPAVRLGFAPLAGHDGFVRQDFLESAGPLAAGSYATYVAGFTQFDAFAIGALVQLHFRTLPRFNTAAAILAMLLVMMLLGFVTTGSAYGTAYGPFLGALGAYQYVWGYLLVALLGGLLVIHFSALPATSPLSRGLAALGAYSYEFYILHYPVIGIYVLFAPFDSLATKLVAALVCLPISAGLAVLLHRTSAQLLTRLPQRSPRPA